MLYPSHVSSRMAAAPPANHLDLSASGERGGDIELYGTEQSLQSDEAGQMTVRKVRPLPTSTCHTCKPPSNRIYHTYMYIPGRNLMQQRRPYVFRTCTCTREQFSHDKREPYWAAIHTAVQTPPPFPGFKFARCSNQDPRRPSFSGLNMYRQPVFPLRYTYFLHLCGSKKEKK